MGLLSYISSVPNARSSSPYNKTIDVIERFGKKELYVNGIQQSGPYTIRLWKNALVQMPHSSSYTVSTVLVLGIGGGTLFPMLHKAFPASHITAVDVDREIIDIYRKYFTVKTETYVTLVCSDARKFLSSRNRTFDLIIADLYIGNDVPEFETGSEFLSKLRRCVIAHGTVIINYFSEKDQQEKSQILLDKLSHIYQSVIRKQNLRNIFYYCSK